MNNTEHIEHTIDINASAHVDEFLFENLDESSHRDRELARTRDRRSSRKFKFSEGSRWAEFSSKRGSRR